MTDEPLAVSSRTASSAGWPVERKDGDLRADTELEGDLEEVARVLAGHVGHAANLALAPE